ncbi:MAG: pyridoxal-phosphate dependent enzyme [Deltaproteobacteria bacterium]|jgi:cysteine synthase B|nr:pyridoxal-phosphate dependent enzyme [Deltaproteobacteria bacterium]
MIYTSILDYIGQTPLLKIAPEIHGLNNVELYAKCELFNPFGSVKDRTALALVKKHLTELKSSGQTFLESSSGNTAKALQVILSMSGIEFKSVTNRIKTPEVREILSALGAKLQELPGLSECPDPTDPYNPISYIANMISRNPKKYFQNSQYYSLDNPAIHHTTGTEIFADLGALDYFFGVLGTTGSTRGVTEFIKNKNPALQTIGIIAEKGDYLPGIRNQDEIHEVGIFERSLYTDIVQISVDAAIDSMLILNRKCGLLCGPTSGGAFAGTIAYLKSNPPPKLSKVVFIACDRLEWYMSYLKKYRPSLFGGENKENVHNLTEQEIQAAAVVSAEDAPKWIAENKPLIIDLRGNTAFKTAHLPGSINITDNIFEDLTQYAPPFSKGNKVLLVCPVGDRSRAFVALLLRKGFDSAYSLDGGIVKYRDLGWALERS